MNLPFGTADARLTTSQELERAASQPGKTDPFDGSWGDQNQDFDALPEESV